jgi:hypothetical protein
MNDNSIQFIKKLLAVLFVVWAVILFWSLAGMQIVLGLIVFTVLIYSLLAHEKIIKYHPFYLWCGIYVLINLIVLIQSPEKIRSLIDFVNNDWVILTIPFIVTLNLSAPWRKRVFQALLISASLAAIYGIFQFFVGLDIFRSKTLGLFGSHYRAVGVYGSFLSYAGNQLMAFACAYAAFLLSTKSKTEKYIYLVTAGILFLSILASQSRSTWLALPVIILLGLIAVPKKHHLSIALILLLLGSGVSLAVPEISSRFLSIFDPAQNETRLNLWAWVPEILTIMSKFTGYPVFMMPVVMLIMII